MAEAVAQQRSALLARVAAAKANHLPADVLAVHCTTAAKTPMCLIIRLAVVDPRRRPPARLEESKDDTESKTDGDLLLLEAFHLKTGAVERVLHTFDTLANMGKEVAHAAGKRLAQRRRDAGGLLQAVLVPPGYPVGALLPSDDAPRLAPPTPLHRDTASLSPPRAARRASFGDLKSAGLAARSDGSPSPLPSPPSPPPTSPAPVQGPMRRVFAAFEEPVLRAKRQQRRRERASSQSETSVARAKLHWKGVVSHTADFVRAQEKTKSALKELLTFGPPRRQEDVLRDQSTIEKSTSRLSFAGGMESIGCLAVHASALARRFSADGGVGHTVGRDGRRPTVDEGSCGSDGGSDSGGDSFSDGRDFGHSGDASAGLPHNSDGSLSLSVTDTDTDDDTDDDFATLARRRPVRNRRSSADAAPRRQAAAGPRRATVTSMAADNSEFQGPAISAAPHTMGAAVGSTLTLLRARVRGHFRPRQR